MATLADVAREALGWFTTTERGEDTIFILRDGRPEWVQDLAYDAHDDLMPDDWRFACIWAALAHVSDNDIETEDAASDARSEYADGRVDIYTGARTAWLATNLTRLGYCDEGRDEFGSDGLDIAELIGLGQYYEASRVFDSVLGSLAGQLEDDAEDEGGGISPEGLELGHRYVMGNVNAYCPKCSDEQGVCVLDCGYDLDK